MKENIIDTVLGAFNEEGFNKAAFEARTLLDERGQQELEQKGKQRVRDTYGWWRHHSSTDWLTVICRYFGGNPDEGSDFISKGFVASAIFMLYTRKINRIFSDFQNRIFDFDIAALDMMNLEWSDIFPRSRINLPFVIPFVFLGDKGETKLIRGATLKGHISGSRRGIPNSRMGLEPPWSQLNLGSIKRL